MRYHQITADERYTLAQLRMQQPRLSSAEIARRMGRHPSTISRELRRNCARTDGAYRASQAQEKRNGRRSWARGWSKLTARQWMLVEDLLRRRFSPDQISGLLRNAGTLRVSHETIYRHIWSDKHAGGQLYLISASIPGAAGSAMPQTNAADEWPANATSPNVLPERTIEPSSDIGRSTPFMGPGASRSSPSSNASLVWS